MSEKGAGDLARQIAVENGVLDGEMEWGPPIRRSGGRVEWTCRHGVGHGNHVHGCDGCCARGDYPGRTPAGRARRVQAMPARY